MKKMRIATKRIILAVVLATAPAAGVVCGQSILDQQLGQKQGDEKKPADASKSDGLTPPQPNDASKNPEKSVAPDMVSPKAAKAVDDIDLMNKLTGGDAGKDDADKMKEMLDRMGQSQARLTDRDPGPVTQETQKRIVSDLDVMIEIARKQQQSGQSKQNQGEKPENGQKRQQTSGQQQGRQQPRGTQAAVDSSPRTGSAATPQSNGEDLHQKNPKEWGNLPPRDRDLISNGASEQYLPSYKEMIDRYYQALAEIGKSKER